MSTLVGEYKWSKKHNTHLTTIEADISPPVKQHRKQYLQRHTVEVDQYTKRFGEGYDVTRMTTLKAIIAAAVAHHQFAWIYPFLVGNSRVVRLMSYASLLRLGV